MLGCSPDRNRKTFVYCSEGSPSSFNPQLGADGPTMNASARMVYSRLLEFKPGSTEIEPSLAKSYRVENKGKRFVFVIRHGVKFQPQAKSGFVPTRDLNAHDVVWSFARMLDKNHPYHSVSGGSYKFFFSMGLQNQIDRVYAKGDDTVVFELNTPDASFLSSLTMDFASVLSKEYGEHLAKLGREAEVDRIPVGSGPYQFVSYSPDNLIRYKRFPDFFQGPTQIEDFVFSITIEPSIRSQKLLSGECDLIAEPSPSDISYLKKTDRVQVVENVGINVGYLAMNTQKKPLSDVRVRRAIGHALNRSHYIESIYFGRATLADSLLPSSVWSHKSSLKDLHFSIDEAQRLMRESGFSETNRLKLSLWTLPVSRPYNPNGKKMGELMQHDLKKAFIDVQLVTYDWPTFLERARNGQHDLIQMGWMGDNGDPDNFLNILLSCEAIRSGGNLARWCNADYDKLMERGKSSLTLSDRVEFYARAQDLIALELPLIPIAYAKVFRAHLNRVKGYFLPALGTEYFERISLEPQP